MSAVDLDLNASSKAARPLPAAAAEGKRVPDWVWSIAASALLFVAWFVASRSGLVKPGYLPTPEELGNTFVDLVKNGYQGQPLLQHIGISLFRTLVGFAIGVAVGVPLGLLTGYSRRAGAM